ncbi:hypothetical protein A2G94_02080 [Francisella endosymbiont of Ornithodoros moubata]|uniref:hypothetical protein n=1 Tax=Francisella-like endosymbiont TaxID=512373 RepID=UPI000A21F30F|nr:hypothetical protein A2G94_02080 [Francisella endosymbiont of Ornithodoros moubata]
MTRSYIDPINQTAQTHFAIDLNYKDYSEYLTNLKSLDTGITSEEFSKEINTKQTFFYDTSFSIIEINNEIK